MREAFSSTLARTGVASAVLVVACAGCGSGASKGGGGGTTDRIVLFDGANFDEWKPEQGDGQVPWQLVDDGSMLVVSGTGNVVSRRAFESLFVHIEYKTPTLPVDVMGQERGNNGVRAPLVNSCREQARWNTYEIEFVAPSYDAGTKLTNGRVTAHLNGELVQDDTEVSSRRAKHVAERHDRGPLQPRESVCKAESCAFRGFQDRREQVAHIVQAPLPPASSCLRVSLLLRAEGCTT